LIGLKSGWYYTKYCIVPSRISKRKYGHSVEPHCQRDFVVDEHGKHICVRCRARDCWTTSTAKTNQGQKDRCVQAYTLTYNANKRSPCLPNHDPHPQAGRSQISFKSQAVASLAVGLGDPLSSPLMPSANAGVIPPGPNYRH
jgi:hypothetical protein